MDTPIPIDRLKEVLEYRPETGDFFWAIDLPRGRKKGSRAEVINNCGYFTINFGGEVYLSHRVAWIWHFGEIDAPQIDHIDRCRTNNRLENLRPATHSQNRANMTKYKNNRSGCKGVYFDGRKTFPWVAQISMNRVQRRIGGFSTLEEAALAYRTAAKQIHGEFARLE